MTQEFPNRGDCYERTCHSRLEAAFADLWEEMNKEEPCVNFGRGILQDLFGEPDAHLGIMLPHFRHVITPEERFVAATVVQWLGTPVGFSFLCNALGKDGWKIVRMDD